jgi:hypothetical protein
MGDAIGPPVIGRRVETGSARGVPTFFLRPPPRLALTIMRQIGAFSRETSPGTSTGAAARLR